MAATKTWLASAVLVGGASGGVVVGLAATGDPAQPTAAAHPARSAPDAGYLQQQIDSLLQEDHALKHAVHRARRRLAGQVRAGELSLAALHRRVLAAQTELAHVQAARPKAASVIAVAAVPAPVTRPAAHATTGASGAGSGSGSGSGEFEGGGDD